jgi:hypothetical protein
MRLFALILVLALASATPAAEPAFHVSSIAQVCQYTWAVNEITGEPFATGELCRVYFRVERKETLRNGMTGYVLLGHICHTEIVPFRPQNEGEIINVFAYNTVNGKKGEVESQIEAIESVTGFTEGYALTIEKEEIKKGHECSYCEHVYFGTDICPNCSITRF